MIKILIIALIWVVSIGKSLRDFKQLEDILKITTINPDPQQKHQWDGNLDSFNDWMKGLQHALTPGGIDVLGQMLLNSGKFINQYGDPEACRDNPNTEYAILRVRGLPISIEIGICAPAGCDSEETYYGLTQYANSKIKEMNVTGIELAVTLPYSASIDRSLNAGTIIVILSTSLIVILGIIGIFVEYFPLFEKPQSLPTEKIEERKTKLGLLFYSFSFKNNLQKLFEVSDRGDANLKILNGIRVFSICWVIVGHVFMTLLGFPASNITTALDITKDWFFTLVPGGFFSVDVFFFMSGFLTFYLLTAKLYPKKACDNYFMIYFHRWFRLFTPALYCLLLWVFIFKYFGNGPKFFNSWNMGCSKNWWSALLFINNLHPWEQGEMWMSWYWYLSNDFEFFLLSPIIIAIYCLSRFGGYAALGFWCLFNYVFNMV